MSTITSFLTFNGNCREAMIFYKSCLGGILNIQTVGELPIFDGMTKKMKDLILYGTLRNGNMILSGSDMVPETGLIKGNAVVMKLSCDSEDEIKFRYQTLAVGGIITERLKYNSFGAMIAGLVDKYDHHWLLSYHQ